MDVAARLAVNLHLQLDFPTAPLPQLEEFLEVSNDP